MSLQSALTAREAAFVQRQRVARLATADGEGNPHAVPVCYAFDGNRFYTPLDDKPKRVSYQELQRVRNIVTTGRAALLVDRYDDDWSLLGYILIRGTAGLMMPEDGLHGPTLLALRERYAQYRAMALEDRPIIAIKPVRVVSWGNLEGEP